MFELVFMTTLEMLKEDTSLYPEHRVLFFPLLDAAIRNCFQFVVMLPDNLLVLIIQAVLWSLQHTIRSISEMGKYQFLVLNLNLFLGITLVVEIIKNLRQLEPVEARQNFYRRFYMEILTHVIAIVTDYNQVPFVGLSNLATAICELFACAENDITVPLNEQGFVQGGNSEYIFEVISDLLVKHFPNLTKDQIRVTIKGFFSYNMSQEKMREHIRDFLVQIKVCFLFFRLGSNIRTDLIRAFLELWRALLRIK
jgi:exportin-1